jgi:fatty acid desaturase
VAAVLADHLGAFAAITIAVVGYRFLPAPLAVAVNLAALVLVARQQRALECLGHEASHYNWSRSHRMLNDVLADLLAAVPVGARIRAYRVDHLAHHGRFGTADDPDLRRYTAHALEPLDRSSAVRFGRELLVRLIPYAAGWWRAIGTNRRAAAASFSWHAALFAFVAVLVTPDWAIVIWLNWLVAFVLVLPVLRLAAESSEHTYGQADTVFDATISNLGTLQRRLIHPHNDGFHTLHHLWPGIPHHRLARLHGALVELDPDGYGARLRFRTRLLAEPTPVRPVRPAAAARPWRPEAARRRPSCLTRHSGRSRPLHRSAGGAAGGGTAGGGAGKPGGHVPPRPGGAG